MKTSILSLATALCVAMPAQAQDTDQSAGWTLSEIIVTASQGSSYSAIDAATLRTPVSIQQTSQSVQVLTRILIGEQDLTEAVLVNPIVRGFESEIYLDGLALYGDTAASDPSSLTGVERIEVAKEPTLQLFGGVTEDTPSVMGSTDTMAWIRDRTSRARHITSVCTDFMVLAKAGLLKGGTLAATSAPVGQMMSEMFAQVAAMFRAQAKG